MKEERLSGLSMMLVHTGTDYIPNPIEYEKRLIGGMYQRDDKYLLNHEEFSVLNCFIYPFHFF